MKKPASSLKKTGRTQGLPALVIFTDQTDLPWLRILKRGFRHCFLAIFQGSHWLIYDPLVHRTEIIALDLPMHFDLANWYREHGLCVVPTVLSTTPVSRTSLLPWAQFPLRPFTCVEAVKRVLGIKAAKIFTPWQLYRHLGVPTARQRRPTSFFP